MTFMTYTPFGRPGMNLLGLLLRGDTSKSPVRGATSIGPGSNPADGCRGPAALANDAGVTRTSLTLPPRWCHRRQARACSVSPAVPQTCPTHRSTAVIHGQQGSVRVSSELEDRSHTKRSEGASQARSSSTEGRSAGDGVQFSRYRAPGHAASGWSHRARPAAPGRSTLPHDTPQSRRSSAGLGSSRA
jgi:hypothetical protein